MHRQHPSAGRTSLLAALTVAVAFVAGPTNLGAQVISKTAMAGPYSVTLKVLPPEAFSGANAPMAWDGGAKAVSVGGRMAPNHHLVAFIEENGKPVEKAAVRIRYRRVSQPAHEWTMLQVARMHVAGQSLATTHFGNNVKLAAGDYEVHVTVNGKGPAAFTFTLTD